MSKYIDVEVIVTKRIHLSDDCNIEAIKEKLNFGDYDISEEEGFIEWYYLSDTEMLHMKDISDDLQVQEPVYMSLIDDGTPIYTPWPL